MIQVLLWKGESPSNTKSSEIVVQYKETTQFRQVYRILIDYHRAQPRVNRAPDFSLTTLVNTVLSTSHQLVANDLWWA